MAKHIESYLCKTCWKIIVPVLRWKGPHVEARCPECGGHIRFVPQSPAVLAAVGPRPVKATTGDLFTDEEDHG